MSSALRGTPGRRARILSVVFAAACIVSGCGSVRPATPPSESPVLSSAPEADVEPILRQEVGRWIGTPHVLGGTTRSGLDCSAFVQRVFADALQVALPRTTEEQVAAGRRVNMSELRPGDLVFFQPPTKTNHVGIYLNGGQFAHVSSSAGVTISELDLEYWRSSYWTSRRVLAETLPRAVQDNSPGEVAVGSAGAIRADPPASPTPRRVGW